ncbi:hypothetical protein HZA97_10040 [Candidatus Woesearchaeota archaeon]|nr:hypothetical protein [Candidatus Woesearchaeota archaeon]
MLNKKGRENSLHKFSGLFLNSKKGDVPSFVLTPTFRTLLALGVVLLTLLYFVNGIGGNTKFERQYYSRDIALLIDTVLSLPGNSNILYSYDKPESETKFTLKVDKEKVTMKDVGENYFPYFLKKDTNFEPVTIEPSEPNIIKIIKSGNNLLIKNVLEKRFPDELNCYKPKESINSVIIDAMHLSNPNSEFHNPGNSYAGISEADLTLKLGKAIKNSATDITIEETRFLERATEGKQANMDAPISLLDRIAKIKSSKAQLLLSLKFGDYDEKFYLKAYVSPQNYEKSYAIACQVLNSIGKKLYENDKKIDGLVIIPLNPEHTSSEDDAVIQEKDGLILEAGSVRNPPNDAEMILIAQAIVEGLK